MSTIERFGKLMSSHTCPTAILAGAAAFIASLVLALFFGVPIACAGGAAKLGISAHASSSFGSSSAIPELFGVPITSPAGAAGVPELGVSATASFPSISSAALHPSVFLSSL
jgi:hypothetical protein